MPVKITKKESAKSSPEQSATSRPVAQGAQVPLLYADGIGNVVMSPIVTKVTLVLHTGPAKEGLQTALPAMELVIPTPALLGFLTQLQQHVKTNGAALVNALDESKKQFRQHMENAEETS